jgi:hypothetical protein
LDARKESASPTASSISAFSSSQDPDAVRRRRRRAHDRWGDVTGPLLGTLAWLVGLLLV